MMASDNKRIVGAASNADSQNPASPPLDSLSKKRTHNFEAIRGRQSGRPTEGQIASVIGTGEAAKDSFVYLTIKWSFIVASVSSAAIFAKGFFDCDSNSLSGIDILKGVWSIFLPIVTLALGYAFGKGR